MSSAAAANAVMMGAGYFTPLTGYMNRADALSVAENMRTTDGLFWPVPVVNLAESCPAEAGQRLALTDPNREGQPLLAVMTVEAIETLSDENVATILNKVFRTDDSEHPGVAAFTAQGRTVISGPIEVLNYSYFEEDFPTHFGRRWRFEARLPSEAGSVWWPSKPATLCTAPTKSCAIWQWKIFLQTVC